MTDPIINTNFEETYSKTESLCKTETEGDTTLYDWMQAGNWQTMTPADMAAEWDSLSED